MRLETAAIHRGRDDLNDCNAEMVFGDKCSLNFLIFVLQLRKNFRKNFNQETDPTGYQIRARWMRVNDL